MKDRSASDGDYAYIVRGREREEAKTRKEIRTFISLCSARASSSTTLSMGTRCCDQCLKMSWKSVGRYCRTAERTIETITASWMKRNSRNSEEEFGEVINMNSEGIICNFLATALSLSFSVRVYGPEAGTERIWIRGSSQFEPCSAQWRYSTAKRQIRKEIQYNFLRI